MNEATTPVYGAPDGFGLYGIVDESSDGLTCHICGWVGAHLGLHSATAHELTANEYRSRFGLRRSKGLVAGATRATIRDNAANRYTHDDPLAASRDLTKANTARLAAARPASPEEAAKRDARIAAMPRQPHARRTVTCEHCGTQFCPIITNIKKRRFCTQSCASKHNRARLRERDLRH